MIFIKNHMNWLMPIGTRLCNLNIQLNSVLLCLAVLDGLSFGVHHSSTENCIFLWECPSFWKWRETGVGCLSFRIDALCSYNTSHPFPKCSACFVNILFLTFSAGYHIVLYYRELVYYDNVLYIPPRELMEMMLKFRKL